MARSARSFGRGSPLRHHRALGCRDPLDRPLGRLLDARRSALPPRSHRGAAFPAATQAMSRWIPRDRNGFAQGVVHSAARLGNAVAPLLVAWVIAGTGNWRWAFVATAVLSVAWAVVWFVWFRDRPESAKGINEAELASSRPARPVRPVHRCRGAAREADPPGDVRRLRLRWTLWVFLTWIPTFLSSTYDLEISSFAWFTSGVLLAGVVGDTVGGCSATGSSTAGGDTRHSAPHHPGDRARRVTALPAPPRVRPGGSRRDRVPRALSFFFSSSATRTVGDPHGRRTTVVRDGLRVHEHGFGIAGVVSPFVFGALIDGRAGSCRSPSRARCSPRPRGRLGDEAAAAHLDRRPTRGRHAGSRAHRRLIGRRSRCGRPDRRPGAERLTAWRHDTVRCRASRPRHGRLSRRPPPHASAPSPRAARARRATAGRQRHAERGPAERLGVSATDSTTTST